MNCSWYCDCLYIIVNMIVNMMQIYDSQKQSINWKMKTNDVEREIKPFNYYGPPLKWRTQILFDEIWKLLIQDGTKLLHYSKTGMLDHLKFVHIYTQIQ